MEYIYYIIIFSRDKYKVNYDKKIFVIINVIIRDVMYGGMIYIISPKKIKDKDLIFVFILGILILRRIYVPEYKVE